VFYARRLQYEAKIAEPSPAPASLPATNAQAVLEHYPSYLALLSINYYTFQNISPKDTKSYFLLFPNFSIISLSSHVPTRFLLVQASPLQPDRASKAAH
jgi:hypothetical protein